MKERLLPLGSRSQTLGCAVTSLLVGASVSWTATAAATDFYVDPSSGADANDGSKAQPWKTLEAVVSGGKIGSTVHAGDTVWLLGGHHGALSVSGGAYAPAITVKVVAGAKATLARAAFAKTSGWVLDGVSISPSYAASAKPGDMVSIDAASSKVVVEHCELFSVPDASSWTADQWINASSSGVSVRGTDVTISRNKLRNVRFGISVDGKSALIEHNEIVNFSADGMRGLGDDGVFQYNVVKNAYVSDTDGDDNHDDGFQSWSVGPGGVGTGVVKGIVLRGNVIINREDPDQKLTNSLQGMGCFDGYFEGWVVENNVVLTDHWHGISLYGARDSRIVNNTVIDVNSKSPGPPWIMVTAHKDGTPSQNVIVRNNLATDYDVSGTNITQDHNTTLEDADLAKYFVDPARFDLRLLPDAPALDAASATDAPALDADGIPRPQGAGIDLGAYEWHDPTTLPPDGGGGPSNGGATNNGGATSDGGATASSGATSSAGAAGGGMSAGGASAGSGAPSGGASAGSPGDVDGGTGSAAHDDAGCGCRVGGSRGGRAGLSAVLALLAVAVRKRGRRSSR